MYTRGKIGLMACSGGQHLNLKIKDQLVNIIKREDKLARQSFVDILRDNNFFREMIYTFGRNFAKAVESYSSEELNVDTIDFDSLFRPSNFIDSRNPNIDLIIKTTEERFANKEFKTVIEENVRDRDIYIVQDPSNRYVGDIVSLEKKFQGKIPDKIQQIRNIPGMTDDMYKQALSLINQTEVLDSYSVNDHLMILVGALAAAKQARARSITNLVPYFPYSRQDKALCREGILAKVVADLMKISGSQTILTMDIHNPAICAYSDIPLENLSAKKNICDYVIAEILEKEEKLVVIGPDISAGKNIQSYASVLGQRVGIVYKRRDYKKHGEIIKPEEELSFIGRTFDWVDSEKTNKEYLPALIVDDMYATGGTTKNAVKILKDKGATKIYAAAALPLFDDPCIERFDELYKQELVDQVIFTNAIFHDERVLNKPWARQIDESKYFARVFYALNMYQSLSRLLDFKK